MRAYLLNQKDGSIAGIDGSAILIGVDSFVQGIVKGGNCFICGQPIQDDQRTEEHIIPDWVQRRYKIRNKRINLINRTSIPYSRYTIPICFSCNQLLGREIEGPISRAAEGGARSLMDFSGSVDGMRRIHVWLSLLFIKTHLRNMTLRAERDLRKSSRNLGEFFDFSGFHHPHAVARSPYSRAEIQPSAIGTTLVFPFKCRMSAEDFDYRDNSANNCVYIRLGDCVIMGVLNDAGLCFEMLEGMYKSFPDELDLPQTYQLLSDLQCASHHIESSPLFATTIDSHSGKVSIIVDPRHPYSTKELDWSVRGHYMAANFSSLVDSMWPNPEIRSAAMTAMQEGRMSFFPEQ